MSFTLVDIFLCRGRGICTLEVLNHYRKKLNQSQVMIESFSPASDTPTRGITKISEIKILSNFSFFLFPLYSFSPLFCRASSAKRVEGEKNESL